jgi:nitrate reductase (NAD(P)H)
MGMMNNCYYRVKVHHHVGPDGSLGLRFQHPAPAPPGERGNVGWREEEKLAKEVGGGGGLGGWRSWVEG